MKDKSRYISSVIVSLLAGFIYYQFGQDINADLQNSLKASFSSNEIDEYLQPNCSSFESFGKVSGIKKTKFYLKKKNTIEFKTSSKNIPGDELFSEFVQAKFQKAIPDKNADFTAELQHLIKGDESINQSKQFKIEKRTSEQGEVADLKSLNSATKLIHKNFELEFGNGFEYNYIIDEGAPTSGSNPGVTGTSQVYIKSYKPIAPVMSYTSCQSSNKVITHIKTKVIVPKNINDEDMDMDINEDTDEVELNCGSTDTDIDVQEFNDNSSDDGSM